MNKREVVWLIVKLIGVYFIYLAFVSAFSLVSSVSNLYSVSSQISETRIDADPVTNVMVVPENFPSRQPTYTSKTAEKSAPNSVSKKLADELFKILLWYVLLTGLYSAVGFYLIRDGQILFALLNREAKSKSKPEEINSLGLFDDEK